MHSIHVDDIYSIKVCHSALIKPELMNTFKVLQQLDHQFPSSMTEAELAHSEC